MYQNSSASGVRGGRKKGRVETMRDREGWREREEYRLGEGWRGEGKPGGRGGKGRDLLTLRGDLEEDALELSRGGDHPLQRGGVEAKREDRIRQRVGAVEGKGAEEVDAGLAAVHAVVL